MSKGPGVGAGGLRGQHVWAGSALGQALAQLIHIKATLLSSTSCVTGYLDSKHAQSPQMRYFTSLQF